jgi:N utilization substance protein A
MNNANFFDAFDMLRKENGIETPVLKEKIELALEQATKKAYPNCKSASAFVDPETKTIKVTVKKLVVEDEPLDDGEINIEDARKIVPNAMRDDEIDVAVDISEFGRNVAGTAKQSIKGDIRDFNRENILRKFDDKEFEIINVKVTRVEQTGNVTVEYDGTELYLIASDCIPGERLRDGQFIKVYVSGIVNRQKKPIIKISRTNREFVRKLFELEVPEIGDGLVEIKNVAREPGLRSKVSLVSNDINIEALGACIGPRRSRINAVIGELSNEKIDLIEYSDIPEEYIESALAPARITEVYIEDPDERACTVYVPEDQLSLAIGNKGCNAKLAARLTGYRIDIKSDY